MGANYIECDVYTGSTETQNSVMVFPSKQLFAGIDQELYMHRSKEEAIPQMGEQNHKKIREIEPEDPAHRRLVEAEAAPWVIENGDETMAFTGKYEGGQTAKYIMFVEGSKGFDAMLMERWYRFTPRTQQHTGSSTANPAAHAENPAAGSGDEESELDYDETFDDDELEETPQKRKKTLAKLSEEGEEVQTIMRHLSRGDETEEESEPPAITPGELDEKLGASPKKMDEFLLQFKDRLQTPEQKTRFKEMLHSAVLFYKANGITYLRKR
ncbi:MAG: transcription factor TFIIF complex alpha subunit Tfg1 [Amphiamblys sp. WSBS2006]|nr:MAG: transcription factor TFIIF complex alpha subunit Tfg1 [Amphiamblys sp. WSBS2006]